MRLGEARRSCGSDGSVAALTIATRVWSGSLSLGTLPLMPPTEGYAGSTELGVRGKDAGVAMYVPVGISTACENSCTRSVPLLV